MAVIGLIAGVAWLLAMLFVVALCRMASRADADTERLAGPVQHDVEPSRAGRVPERQKVTV